MQRLLSAALVVMISLSLAGDTGPSPSAAKIDVASADLPGGLKPVWSAVFWESHFSTQGPYAFSEESVLLPADWFEDFYPPGGDPDGADAISDGVDIRDTRTGEIRTRIADIPDHSITGAGFANGTLVLDFEEDNSGNRILMGVDSRSGKQLWSTPVRDSGPPPEDTTVFAPTIMIAPNGVLMVTSDDRHLIRVDPFSGQETWRWPLPIECVVMIAAKAVAIVLRDCEDGSATLTALDMRTGQTVWQSSFAILGPESTPRSLVMGPEGEILVSLGNAYRIYGPDGRLIMEDPGIQGWGFGASEQTMLVISNPAGAQSGGELRAVDRTTGQSQWTRHLDASPILGIENSEELPRAGKFLVAQSYWSASYDWPLPYFIAVINPADGQIRNLPVPSDRHNSELLGAIGEFVFVRDFSNDGQRVTAYRMLPAQSAGSPELGGIAPSEWPDACSLISLSDIASIGSDYRMHAQAGRLGDITFPHPTRCDLVPQADRDPLVSLTILWVARSKAEASRLVVSSLLNDDQDAMPSEAAPGVYRVPEVSMNGTHDTALIRSGTVIAKLVVHRQPKELVNIAEKVAKNMGRS
ncbi:hypothetical protein GCM10009555_047500 [Acrocarpospora macrocephala]|uniref:Pyrrolo-quinoline quinone repeat domain-containing protein n=1 Tax=Acrocarpospora macrocephala TaxID=150177 RepID=A0A5M3WV40_9ACTN|nr:PQQ-binding-like beta-propeller repeat protein [Acrocarpospora macrocephala]GES12092.1 hypothetical protein Amac_056890 [Acrocarpospora macrocephala]